MGSVLRPAAGRMDVKIPDQEEYGRYKDRTVDYCLWIW